jgi:hypothetical protein
MKKNKNLFIYINYFHKLKNKIHSNGPLVRTVKSIGSVDQTIYMGQIGSIQLLLGYTLTNRTPSLMNLGQKDLIEWVGFEARFIQVRLSFDNSTLRLLK